MFGSLYLLWAPYRNHSSSSTCSSIICLILDEVSPLGLGSGHIPMDKVLFFKKNSNVFIFNLRSFIFLETQKILRFPHFIFTGWQAFCMTQEPLKNLQTRS